MKIAQPRPQKTGKGGKKKKNKKALSCPAVPYPASLVTPSAARSRTARSSPRGSLPHPRPRQAGPRRYRGLASCLVLCLWVC